MDSQNIYVTKTLIGNDNQSELDFVLYDDFGFSYDTHDKFVEIQKGKGYYADATPIKIDDMIKILQSLKEKGATHVQLEDHCDHQGYDISGFEIRLSNHDEIVEYEAMRKVEMEKKQRVLEFQNEINKIKNSW
jgi:hypothetical protein